jgi:hypothetical protein
VNNRHLNALLFVGSSAAAVDMLHDDVVVLGHNQLLFTASMYVCM